MRNSIGNTVLILALPLLAAGSGAASAQANDNWANRTVIAALPFQSVEPAMAGATLEASDPDPPCRPEFATLDHTVWYSYTTGANPEYVTVDALSPDFVTLMAVYTGTPGNFRVVTGGCGGGFQITDPSLIPGLRLQPNTAYSFIVGATNGFFTGTLTFNLRASALYPVTKTDDTNDGTCDADCSLREAIGAANIAPGAVLIPAGTYTLTIPGTDEDANATGDLDVTCGMGIYGAGMNATLIDAATIDRVLDFDRTNAGYCTLTLGDLALVNGRGDQFGGGLRMSNTGSAPYADFLGMERVAIRASQATARGAGAHIMSAAVIRDSVFADNSGPPFGGGIAFFRDPNGGFIEISGSTFVNNSATQDGGGLYSFGSARIVDSTFSGNHAGMHGGGIHHFFAGSLFVASSSIVFNTGATNPGATDSGAGVRLDGNGSAVFINDIVAGNSVANPSDPPDCARGSDTLTSHHNHVQAPGASCVFAGLGDVTGTDPAVNPGLSFQGGPTPVHGLLTGSAAIDAGDPTGCKDAAGLPLAYDQRGAPYARVRNGVCDKGAFEWTALIFGNGFE